jgi:hypothetical protein
MSHQGAMEAKTRADKVEAEHKPLSAKPGEPSKGIYLATELTAQVSADRLTLAFRGLQMPDAMTKAAQHVPVLAIPLSLDNVHQLIELFITKAREAHWHLPVELPWLESPKAANTSADGIFRTH